VFAALQPTNLTDRKVVPVHVFDGGCREISLRQLSPRDQADADHRGASEVLSQALRRTLDAAYVAIAGRSEADLTLTYSTRRSHGEMGTSAVRRRRHAARPFLAWRDDTGAAEQPIIFVCFSAVSRQRVFRGAVGWPVARSTCLPPQKGGRRAG
jgi:hypothetical protein